MQVVTAQGAVAWCRRRGLERRIGTLLIGEVAAGDWLLVHLDQARERIDAARAAEIDTVLDLLEAAQCGDIAAAAADPGFALPSRQKLPIAP
jgi:hydrogenase expression/formation protein HypC